MGIRTREELHEDQAGLLAEYRAGLGAESMTEGAVAAEAAALIGRVTSVVTSDPTYGAHLVVEPQVFTGTPPAASAASQAPVRAYPTPERVVTDYSVDEYVSVVTVRGGLLALKLG